MHRAGVYGSSHAGVACLIAVLLFDAAPPAASTARAPDLLPRSQSWIATAPLPTPRSTRTDNTSSGATVDALASLPCDTPANPIIAENCLPGTAQSVWDVSGAGDLSIQGFATDISVNKGQTVSFKISTTGTKYRLDIYRMGYYGGLGARLVATVPSSGTVARSQPSCLTDAATGLIDCGNWTVTASWGVPAAAASGIYFARATREDAIPGDPEKASLIFFIVRDDGGRSDVLVQTSDETW